MYISTNIDIIRITEKSKDSNRCQQMAIFVSIFLLILCKTNKRKHIDLKKVYAGCKF